jgi:dTDP-4-dehydrorhamnose 3,5-epimerase
MHFVETGLAGAYLIELDRHEDERGFFARSFCEREFVRYGLPPRFVQCNVSFNRWRGTIRGLHWQAAPHEEAKVVRCTRGALYDVVVDLRAGSPTRHCWAGFALSAQDHRQIFVPAGFAHGFQTLEPDTEVFYMMSTAFEPSCARGMRWNDPALSIAWPLVDPVLSERDASWPLLEQA